MLLRKQFITFTFRSIILTLTKDILNIGCAVNYLDPEMRSKQAYAPSPLSVHPPSPEDMNDSGISLDGEYCFHICYTKAMMYNVIKDVTVLQMEN